MRPSVSCWEGACAVCVVIPALFGWIFLCALLPRELCAQLFVVASMCREEHLVSTMLGMYGCVTLCNSVYVFVLCSSFFIFLFLSFPSSPSRIEGPSIRGKGDRGREGGGRRRRGIGVEEGSWFNAREEELAHCPESRERARELRRKKKSKSKQKKKKRGRGRLLGKGRADRCSTKQREMRENKKEGREKARAKEQGQVHQGKTEREDTE